MNQRGAVLLPDEVVLRRRHLLIRDLIAVGAVLVAAATAYWSFWSVERARQVAFDFKCPGGAVISMAPPGVDLPKAEEGE